jgi:hypothetical protein
MNLTKRCIAEFLGTAWLVLGGCRSAVLAASCTEAKTQRAGEAAAKAASALGIDIWGLDCLWSNCGEHGLCHRAYFGLSSQSGGVFWSVGW